MNSIRDLAERFLSVFGLDAFLTVGRFVQVVQFSLIGASGIVVDLGLTAGTLSVGFHYLVANGCGYVVAVSSNFLLNYRITWDMPERSLKRMYVEYLSADVVLFAVRVGIVAFFVEQLGVRPIISSVVGILVVAAATFFVADTVVFDDD